MTKVRFYRKGDTFTGFEIEDHTGFAESGSDIVCSAISALTINTINSIEALTEDIVKRNISEKMTYISLKADKPSDRCETLIKSLYIGLSSVAESYRGYIDLKIMEV